MKTDALHVSSRMARRLPLLARTLGLDAAKLCRELNLDEATLNEPGARVPLGSVLTGLEDILLASRHPALGLALAKCAEPGTYETPALIMMASATLSEGFERAFHFQRLWGDGDRFALLPGNEAATVRFGIPGPRRVGHGVLEVCALAETMLAVRFLTGRFGARARSLSFPIVSDDSTHLAEHFGVEPELGAEVAQVTFDGELFNLPLPNENALFLRAFEQRAVEELSRLPALDDFMGRLQAEMLRGLVRGRFALGDCARALGMSTRTLERRLTEYGASYQEVLDAIRKPRALSWLREGKSVDEVALLLGYSERSSLHRACLRWFQKTPAALRER